MFLPLAERMVEKMVKEEKIEAEAEVSKDCGCVVLHHSHVKRSVNGCCEQEE